MSNTDPSIPITNLFVLDLIDAVHEFKADILAAYADGMHDHLYHIYDEPGGHGVSEAERQAYRAGWQRAEKDKNR